MKAVACLSALLTGLAAAGPEVIWKEAETLPVDGKFLSLGKFRFEKEGSVLITNKDTDGYVIADGVQWLPAE